MSAATTFDELDHAVPVLDAVSAVSAAAAVSAELAVGAAERDARRILPAEQLAVLSASGLLGITVPREYGGADDPLVVHAFGQMELEVRAAEALLTEAGLAVEHADRDLTAQTAGEASLAVAAARASSARAAVEVGSRMFEVAGTRSALASLNLDRHWRNARTHTLHDPASWKVQHLGRYAVDGTLPPNHGQL